MKRENQFRYSKLANILREQIVSGYIKPGQYLMSENDLCKHYGISRTSVRKSLEQLLNEGLIVKKAGQGTMVAPHLEIPSSQSKVLRIFAASPSHFLDYFMPVIIKEFEAENPNVEVKCLNFSTAEFWESYYASTELGLQPDIILLSDRQVNEAEHLEDFIDLRPIRSIAFDNMYPRLLDHFDMAGELKAAPVTFSTVFLAYNPELFQKFGVAEPAEHWTRDDFLHAAERLTMDTNHDGINDQFGLTLSSSLGRWPVIAMQNGMDFKRGSKLEPVTNTLRFLHELLFKRGVATLSPRHLLNSDAFIRGKAAMVMTTFIEMAKWKHNGIGFTPKLAALPFGDQKATILISNALMIPTASGEKELAERFLEKTLSLQMQEKLCKSSTFLSPLRPINEQVLGRSLLQSLYMDDDIIENSQFLHQVFSNLSRIDELEAEMTLFWSGLESAEEFAGRLIHMLDEDE